MSTYLYKGPMIRRQRPGKVNEESLVFVANQTYELKEGEFPGLMDRQRDVSLGRLELMPKAATKPKATASTSTSTSASSSSRRSGSNASGSSSNSSSNSSS